MRRRHCLEWKFLFLGEHTHAPGHISAIFVFSLGERVLYAFFRMHIVHGLQISRAHEFYDGIHLWDSTIHFKRSRVAAIERKLASSQTRFNAFLYSFVELRNDDDAWHGVPLPFIEMFLIINFPNSTFIASNAQAMNIIISISFFFCLQVCSIVATNPISVGRNDKPEWKRVTFVAIANAA